MRENRCHNEAEVLTAVTTGQWSEALRLHADVCPICHEILQVADALRGLSRATSLRNFKSAQLLWTRAEFARKEERLSWLDLFVVTSAVLAALTGLAALLFWQWPRIAGTLREVLPHEAELLPWPLVAVAGLLFLCASVTALVMKET